MCIRSLAIVVRPLVPPLRDRRHRVAKRRDVPLSMLTSPSLYPHCVADRNNCDVHVYARMRLRRLGTPRETRPNGEKERARRDCGENSNEKERAGGECSRRVFPAYISLRGGERAREREKGEGKEREWEGSTGPCTPRGPTSTLAAASATIPFHSPSLSLLLARPRSINRWV